MGLEYKLVNDESKTVYDLGKFFDVHQVDWCDAATMPNKVAVQIRRQYPKWDHEYIDWLVSDVANKMPKFTRLIHDCGDEWCEIADVYTTVGSRYTDHQINEIQVQA